jgi:hypothetical protein
MQQHDIVTVGDPFTAKLHPHSPPQRLHIQQSLRQRLGRKEMTHRSDRKRTLLPRQTHDDSLQFGSGGRELVNGAAAAAPPAFASSVTATDATTPKRDGTLSTAATPQWCTGNICGNRARVARHYERTHSDKVGA